MVEYFYGFPAPPVNQAPNTPAAPTGPSEGDVNIPYEFTGVTTDPEGDNIAYQFDWGDQSFSDWTAFTGSGQPKTVAHQWVSNGTYYIRVRAKDTHSDISSWSNAAIIVITGASWVEYPLRICFSWNTGPAQFDEYMAVLSAGGFNLIQVYDAYYRGTKYYRDQMSYYALKNNLKLCPYPGYEGDPDIWEWLWEERADDPAVWGWQFEEPWMRGASAEDCRVCYNRIKAVNPNWKIFTAFGDSSWYSYGYCNVKMTDFLGVDIYPCALSEPRGYVHNKLDLLFKGAIRTMIDTQGAEWCPTVMAWAGQQWNCQQCIRMQFEENRDVVDRGIPKGMAYYLFSGFHPLVGNDPEHFIWNQIVAQNSAFDAATWSVC